MRFSNGSYVCLFILFVLHSIGAHYTYSLVPDDVWWQTLTGSTLNQLPGWERNHYARRNRDGGAASARAESFRGSNVATPMPQGDIEATENDFGEDYLRDTER